MVMKEVKKEILSISRDELFSLGLCLGTLSTLSRVELNDKDLIYSVYKAQNEAKKIVDCIEKRLAVDIKDFTYFITNIYNLLIKTECKFVTKKNNEILDLQEHINVKFKNAIGVLMEI